jgi:hypothetical protein
VLESCPVVDFRINDVDLSGSATVILVIKYFVILSVSFPRSVISDILLMKQLLFDTSRNLLSIF